MDVKYNCTDCGQPKVKYRTNTRRSLKEWNYVDPDGKRVQGRVCFSCTLARRRRYLAATGNKSTKKYEKTKQGFLMRLYRNMKSRIEGVQTKKHHLYKGKDLLSKKGFYEWADSSPEFHRLFAAYEASGYERRLAPSVDRIDSAIGYVLPNLRWVTMSQNSTYACLSRWKKHDGKPRWVKISDADAVEIKRRRMAGEIARTIAEDFGIDVSHVYYVASHKAVKVEQISAPSDQCNPSQASSQLSWLKCS